MDTEKIAIGINGVINAMTAVDGAKTMKSSYHDTNNKYDNMLSTNVNKGSRAFGGGNKSIANRTASDEIEHLSKEAGFKSSVSRAIKSGKTKAVNFAQRASKNISEFDENTTKNISQGISKLKNGEIKDGAKKLAKGSAMASPAIIGMGAAGIGATKSLNAMDEKFNAKKNKKDEDRKGRVKFENKALGTGLTAALTINALAGKSAYKPAKTVAKAMKSELVKIPLNKIRRHVPGAGTVVDHANKAGNALKKNQKAINHYAKTMQRMGKSFNGNPDEFKKIVINRTKDDFFSEHKRRGLNDKDINKLWDKSLESLTDTVNSAFESVKGTFNKKASDEISYLMEKVAGSKVNYAKKVFKENF